MSRDSPPINALDNRLSLAKKMLRDSAASILSCVRRQRGITYGLD